MQGRCVGAVVSSPPFGLNLRVPDEQYVLDILANVRACVRGSPTWCLHTKENYREELEEVGLSVVSEPAGLWNGKRNVAYVTLAR